MDQEEITEGNKIIAEFMGLTYKSGLFSSKFILPGYRNDQGKVVAMSSDQLKYHKDWNWLMPVYEKIIREDLYSEDEEGIEISCVMADRLIDAEGIEEVFHWVVKFIKWYKKKSETL